jgi:methylmalonyl-CoA/ethylmalonyl-CoA epimerase
MIMSSIDRADPASGWAIGASTFHHYGFVVKSIDGAVKNFAESLDANWDGKIIHDPLQVVRVTFLQPRTPGNPVVELIEPAGDRSPVLGFLKRGGGLHHLCYEVDDLEKQLEIARSMGMLVTRPPRPAVAFDGRRIAFVYTKHLLLLELLEK